MSGFELFSYFPNPFTAKGLLHRLSLQLWDSAFSAIHALAEAFGEGLRGDAIRFESKYVSMAAEKRLMYFNARPFQPCLWDSKNHNFSACSGMSEFDSKQVSSARERAVLTREMLSTHTSFFVILNHSASLYGLIWQSQSTVVIRSLICLRRTDQFLTSFQAHGKA